MKIVHLNTLGPLNNKLQNELTKYCEYISITKENNSEEDAADLINDADILLVEPSALKPLTKDIIEKCSNLKHIALVTVGYDWVDIDYCLNNEISVSIPIGANSEAVAEHVFGLFLDLSKRITEFYIDVKFNNEYDFRNYIGTELYEKTLGIIGLGNIGHKVKRIAKGFNMNVLAYDRSEESTNDYKIVDFNTLLKESDYIAITIPLTDTTRNLISTKEVSMMRKGVIIANTSREGVVDTEAIVEGLRNNRIRGYGVESPIMKAIDRDNKLLQFKNTIVIPHNAFNTEETNCRVNRTVVENIIAFINRETKNLV